MCNRYRSKLSFISGCREENGKVGEGVEGKAVADED